MMAALKKRIFVGMVSGLIMFVGGLSSYQIITEELVDELQECLKIEMFCQSQMDSQMSDFFETQISSLME